MYKKISSLSDRDIFGFFYFQRYGFLTVDQYCRLTGRNKTTAYQRLNGMECGEKWLKHFGNVPAEFGGRVPKIYYLTKKGYEVLLAESNLTPEQIGAYKNRSNFKWTNKTRHRLALIDAFISLEVGLFPKSNLSIPRVYLDYSREKTASGGWKSETQDFISDEETPQNRIIPDGVFTIEHRENGEKGLFFVEMDMGTETIESKLVPGAGYSLQSRLDKYVRYLLSGRYAAKYGAEFDSFTLLFITTSPERVENIRRKIKGLPPKYLDYFFFTTQESAKADFFGSHWMTGNLDNSTGESII